MKKAEDARWSCVPTRRGLPRPWIRGGEGRPRSLLRPRNPTTGRAADDRILSVREGESPAVPSRPSIVLYLGGLSFSSPSVLPTLPMHTQTPPNRLSSMGTLEPLSTQPTRWRTAWSINPKSHPLSLPLKSLSAEGQTVLSGGTFSEVPEETTQDNPNGQQDGQRAANRSIAPRSAVAPDPRGVLAFGLSFQTR